LRAPRWTSGIDSLVGGRHELRIQAVDKPRKMGRGDVRIDRDSAFDTFASEDLSENFGPARGADSFRTT
jgi:hypothetical protein